MKNSNDDTARQLDLFDSLDDSQPKSSKNGTSFNDPAFASNKSLPIHRWVPWIAGFASSFVRGALDRYLPERGVVLDPFAGVGTTLVEAILNGHDAIGFEINPYAAMACRIKLTAYQISVEQLIEQLHNFQVFYNERVAGDYVPTSSPPEGFKGRAEFYSPQVLHKVLILHDFINGIADERLQDLFRLAFASTMVRYSNYSYEPSLGRRVSAGREEIEDFAVDEAIVDKLTEMADDIRYFQNHMRRQVSATVVNSSFFNYSRHLSSASVDLVITSPPYLNNYHYNRNTRPHLYWLGFVEKPGDLKELEEANFGKYWQTVREKEAIGLDFELAGSDLAERLAAIRQLNAEKGIYGGNGWANYAATYFNDCYRFVQGLDYSLKSGGAALIVIGNSILQGVMIPTDVYLGKIAEALGLELVEIHIPRQTRVGNSIIQSDVRVGKADDKHQLYEAVVELRKP